jgi:hypothetical protein
MGYRIPGLVPIGAPTQCFTLASAGLFAYTEAVVTVIEPIESALRWMQHFSDAERFGIIGLAIIIGVILIREASEYRRNTRVGVPENYNLKGPKNLGRI